MRKTRVFSIIGVAVILASVLIMFYMKNSEYKAGVVKERQKAEAIGTSKFQVNGDENDFKIEYDVVAKTGPIRKLPWDNDDQFLTAIKDNGDLFLLGAYQTVLRDPLPGEEYNVHLAAKMLTGTIIKPGEVFSQNGTVGPYTEERGFQRGPTYIGTQLTTTIGGGVCKIASTLYNVATISDLQVIERHAHGMPVPYVPIGQDATVAYGVRDFKFMNTTTSPVMIWAQGIDNTLYMAFYGKKSPRKIQWHHQILNVEKASKVYKVNASLAQDTEKVVLEGVDGSTVRSWLTIINSDGTIEMKNLGISHYKPMATIIEKGKS